MMAGIVILLREPVFLIKYYKNKGESDGKID